MSTAQPRPECPRCGYDLAGLIATWTHACPLQSTCSECGLEFECGRALSPRLIGPRWSYEHTHEPRIRRWWGTSWTALWPRRMFRELEVDHQVRAARLLRFIAWWLAIAHVTTAAIVIATAWRSGLMNPTFRGMGLLSDPEFWSAFWPRVLFPYGHELSVPSGPRSSMYVPLLPLYLLVLIPTLLMPAWMMLLGTSMRMAKVRRAHLLRGLAFSLPCAAAYLAVLLATIFAIPTLGGYTNIQIPPVTLGGVMLLCFGHHLYWWFLFVRRYLRLRHASAVVLLHTVMNGLVFAIVMIVVSSFGMRF